MDESGISQLVDKALLEGIIEAECMECGVSLQCRPDAKQSWCDNCNKTVEIRNDLIKHGFI
jgi:hypothetical protein